MNQDDEEKKEDSKTAQEEPKS
jgi:hypothetical protein